MIHTISQNPQSQTTILVHEGMFFLRVYSKGSLTSLTTIELQSKHCNISLHDVQFNTGGIRKYGQKPSRVP